MLEESLLGVGTVLRPSQKGCVVNGQMTQQMSTPRPPALIGDVIDKQESRHKLPKSVLRAVLALRLVQAMSAWLVKTRRAPSRHSRDARVYGHYDYGHAQTQSPPHPAPPSPRIFHARSRNRPPTLRRKPKDTPAIIAPNCEEGN